MTAANSTNTASAVPLHKRLNARAYIPPACILAAALLLLGFSALNRLTKHQADPQTMYQAGHDGVVAALTAAQKQAAAATSVPPPAPVPAYDYLTCSHQLPTDPTPCAPLLAWPLTDGAKELIGRQANPVAPGELSTVKTRIVADQIRNKFPSVDACSLWLSIDRSDISNPILTVWPNQQKAPSGAVALVDCTPRGSTKGSIPTDGAA